MTAQKNDPRAANPAAAWDGTLDDGSVARSGSYTVRTISHDCVYAWDGVVGNSSPDHSSLFYWNPSTIINGIAFSDARKGYAVSGYTEKWATLLVFDENNVQYCKELGTIDVTNRVATDSVSVYVGIYAGRNNYVRGFNCTTGAPIQFSARLDIHCKRVGA
jgi:hypothetical protein